MSRLDYSKWNHIEVSDDEDDTHPNVDTASLFRWRHQARVERMDEQEQEKARLKKEEEELKKKTAEIQKKTKQLTMMDEEVKRREATKVQTELAELKRQEDEFKKKEAELTKKERLTPWNVDTLSKPGFEKTVINVPKAKQTEELDENAKYEKMKDFISTHESKIKKFGMLNNYDASRDYLRDNPELVCLDTANYLTMWCVNLEVQEKSALMKRVAHQTIVMQYILELAKQLDRDPRSCAPGFFIRMKSAEKTYMDAFHDELQAFIKRVEGRAKARLEEAAREAEEEARQKRLGPGGLDPVEVLETLPQELRECFETKSISKLQEVLSKLSKEEASYHMKRCVDSGLWVSDAKAAGLTPASEELQKLKDDGQVDIKEGERDVMSDRIPITDEEIYEEIDSGDLGLD